MPADLHAQSVFLPMLVHVAMSAALYAALTVVRAPAVWGVGLRRDGTNPWEPVEPRISANLRNQFEWPVFFHVACVLGVLTGASIKSGFLFLAWTFVAGRFAHSAVQILTQDVRLRGLVFTVNFVAVLGMWAYLVVT